MCHSHGFDTDWARDHDEEEAAESDDELPSFATAEAGDDVEVLTDGGDGA